MSLFAIRRRSDGRLFRTWKHKGERWVPSFGPEKFRLVGSESFAAEIVNEISEFTGQPADCEVVPVVIGEPEPSTDLDRLMERLTGLKWRIVNGYPNGTVCPVYEADTIFGRYIVNGAGRGFGGSPGRASYVIPGRGEIECDSIDNGKELCFQDYQSRVRALFEE